MYLRQLHILNYKNIQEADLCFSPKINCLVGNNGMGKTNVLDAVYYLSFCKSAFNNIDSQNICHTADFCMIQGEYDLPSGMPSDGENTDVVTCGIKRGRKKQFRLGKKNYTRLIDHIGLIPLVMISPQDTELIVEGSDERRRFMDVVISQYDKPYLQHLLEYNALLKQRNSLLKQIEEQNAGGAVANQDTDTLFDVLEMQMVRHAEYIYGQRTRFVEVFIPVFQDIYGRIAQNREQVGLRYISQLQDRDMLESMRRTRQRDLVLGWTSQGIHKDDLEMRQAGYPLKQVGSQGQQKTYLVALKLAQAVFLAGRVEKAVKPIMLLDDIFDKLDALRVENIVKLVNSDAFGQIFITDTDRQHLVDLLLPLHETSKVFLVEDGVVKEIEESVDTKTE